MPYSWIRNAFKDSQSSDIRYKKNTLNWTILGASYVIVAGISIGVTYYGYELVADYF